MTRDPSNRLATVEQIMNGNNPFEKISTPLGTMERWKAEAMIIGTTSGALHVFESITTTARSTANATAMVPIMMTIKRMSGITFHGIWVHGI